MEHGETEMGQTIHTAKDAADFADVACEHPAIGCWFISGERNFPSQTAARLGAVRSGADVAVLVDNGKGGWYFRFGWK